MISVEARMSRRGRRIALASFLVLVAVLGSGVWRTWREIAFWWRFEAVGTNQQGCREYRHRASGILFVEVPGGTFLMGSPDGELGRDRVAKFRGVASSVDVESLHTVELSSFLIGKYEVRQREWKRSVSDDGPGVSTVGENYPVEGVSWEDCRSFCDRLGLSLPTEAQWEFACRAGSPGLYAGGEALGELAWYKDNSEGRSHQVGLKRPNAFGIHDMHGNVMEWCKDYSDLEFYGRIEASLRDPVCDVGVDYAHVLRGGDFRSSVYLCRCADRGVRASADCRAPGLGFRAAYGPVP